MSDQLPHFDEAHAPSEPRSDTSADVTVMQEDIFRRMGGEQRLLAALELTDMMFEVTRCRIRAEHPHFTEDEVRHCLIWEVHGVDVRNDPRKKAGL